MPVVKQQFFIPDLTGYSAVFSRNNVYKTGQPESVSYNIDDFWHLLSCLISCVWQQPVKSLATLQGQRAGWMVRQKAMLNALYGAKV